LPPFGHLNPLDRIECSSGHSNPNSTISTAPLPGWPLGKSSEPGTFLDGVAQMAGYATKRQTFQLLRFRCCENVLRYGLAWRQL